MQYKPLLVCVGGIWPLLNWKIEIDGCGNVIDELKFGNGMEGKDGTSYVPYNENEVVVDIMEEASNSRIDDKGGVMEIPPWIPCDKGMGCDIVDEPLLPNIVLGWWNKENGGPTMVITSWLQWWKAQSKVGWMVAMDFCQSLQPQQYQYGSM